jgi:hypothetical protein
VTQGARGQMVGDQQSIQAQQVRLALSMVKNCEKTSNMALKAAYTTHPDHF